MTSRKKTISPRRGMQMAVLLCSMFALTACSHQNTASRGFSSPEDAVQALTSALRADDATKAASLMGPEGQQIVSSGDEVADRARRHRFLALYDQKHSLVQENSDSATLLVGNNQWPFPVPLVRRGNSWSFDSQAGVEEILNRRIGQNELSAMEVCRAIVDAQREYALRDPDGDGVRSYASQFPSDPGRRNGLYWPVAPGEQPSPLGELVAQAAEESYARRAEGPTPYHGYYYRILKAQGPHAPGGTLNYTVDGQMPLGFAVVAHPAEYGNSGIMTFLVNAQGTLYQKDLGEKTAEIAGKMTAFDPGEGWTKVP